MASERYQRFKARIQRLQFILALGFAVAALGAVLVAPLMVSLNERLARVPGGRIGAGAILASLALGRLWVYAVLPVVAYGAARLVPLVPWPSAVGLVLVGEGFYLVLDAVTGGLEAVLHGGLFLLARLGTDALGVVLAAQAMALARRQAESSKVQSEAKNAERAGEYRAFLKEAERLADLRHGVDVPSGEIRGPTQIPGKTGGSSEGP